MFLLHLASFHSVTSDWLLCVRLTRRGRCVFEQLVELTQVHHHGQRVRFSHRQHFLHRHQRRNPKLLLGHVEAQSSVFLHRRLVQGVKGTVERQEVKLEKKSLCFNTLSCLTFTESMKS